MERADTAYLEGDAVLNCGKFKFYKVYYFKFNVLMIKELAVLIHAALMLMM